MLFWLGSVFAAAKATREDSCGSGGCPENSYKKENKKGVTIVIFVDEKLDAMNLHARKLNLINWISSIQEEEVLAHMEKVQEETSDWWNSVSKVDKKAICDGLEQLDSGDYLSRSQVRNKIKEKFNL